LYGKVIFSFYLSNAH